MTLAARNVCTATPGQLTTSARFHKAIFRPRFQRGNSKLKTEPKGLISRGRAGHVCSLADALATLSLQGKRKGAKLHFAAPATHCSHGASDCHESGSRARRVDFRTCRCLEGAATQNPAQEKSVCVEAQFSCDNGELQPSCSRLNTGCGVVLDRMRMHTCMLIAVSAGASASPLFHRLHHGRR